MTLKAEARIHLKICSSNSAMLGGDLANGYEQHFAAAIVNIIHPFLQSVLPDGMTNKKIE